MITDSDTSDNGTERRRLRRVPGGVAVVLVAGGMLIPTSGSASAQAVCDALDDVTRTSAPSQLTAAERETVLQLHNHARAELGVPPLTWDDSLADTAQGWADISAPVGRLCHDKLGGHGENLADYATVAAGVQGWYSQKARYDAHPQPIGEPAGNWSSWGHYTQMVWSTTQRIGCGKAPSTGIPGNTVLACRYDPAGNVTGAFPYPPGRS